MSGGADKWDDWNESGWSEDSPAKRLQQSTLIYFGLILKFMINCSSKKVGEKKKSAASKSKNKDNGSLIDFDNNSTAASKGKDDGWNNNWEDDAWESLNN